MFFTSSQHKTSGLRNSDKSHICVQRNLQTAISARPGAQAPVTPPRIRRRELGLSDRQIKHEIESSACSFRGLLPAEFDALGLEKETKAFLSYLWTKAKQGPTGRLKTYFRCHSLNVIRKFLGDDYRKTLDTLLEKRLIQADDRFEIGVRSKGYRIHERFFASESIKAAFEGELGQKLKAIRRSEEFFNTPNEAYLRSNQDKLVVDVNASWIDIQLWYDKQPCATQEQTATRKLKYEARINALRRMSNPHERYQHTCDFGRIHGPHTNSAKEVVRHLMTKDGIKAISKDYKNSQICCIADTAMRWAVEDLSIQDVGAEARCLALLATKGQHRLHLGWSRNQETGERWTMESLQDAYMQDLLDAIQISRSAEGREEIAKFVEECNSGMFYERMAKLMGPEWEALLLRDRTAFKGKIFAFIYGKPWHTSRAKKQFDAVYPHMAKLIAIMKRRDYGILPKYMQWRESQAFQPVVAKCREKGWVVLTVHDSLLIFEKLSQQDQAEVDGWLDQAFRYVRPIIATSSHQQASISQPATSTPSLTTTVGSIESEPIRVVLAAEERSLEALRGLPGAKLRAPP